MNTTEIVKILKKRCGRVFLGVFPIDRLPVLPARRPLLLVCNTDPHNRPGEHWIVLYIDKSGEYFDSFGQMPQLTFKLYMNRHCNTWIKSERALQSVLSSFCGHYCVFYCFFRSMDYDLIDVNNAFTIDTALNDYIVHRFVCDKLKN